MLMTCDRHTIDDLALWSVMEDADKSHIIRIERIEHAINVIRKFSLKRCYIATSWGKDSIVAAHLAWRANPHLPFVFIRQEGFGEDPYQMDVQTEFERITGIVTDVIRVPLESFSSGRSPALETGIKISQNKYGKRYIGGLRASESGARAIRWRVGLPENSCWPIGQWSVADVFAYIAQHNLPCHPAYAMVGGGRWDREQIRVSTIGGHKGRGLGRNEWEQEYYGDVLARMQVR
jgi:phosphoadenosine phosphosulfate reductase